MTTAQKTDLTIAEAADLHGSTRQAIYQALARGKIAGAYKRGTQWFVPLAELRRWERTAAGWREAYERGRLAAAGAPDHEVGP